MEYLDDLFDLLPREIGSALKAMSKTNDLSQKKIYSEIVLNLSKSMSVFYEALDMPTPDFLDEFDEFDDFDDMDAIDKMVFQPTPIESPKPKKGKKSKKKFN